MKLFSLIISVLHLIFKTLLKNFCKLKMLYYLCSIILNTKTKMRQVTVNTAAQTQSNFAANGKHLDEVDLTFQLEGYFYVGQTIEGLDAYQYNDCNDFMYIDTKRCLLFNTNKNIVGYYVRQ